MTCPIEQRYMRQQVMNGPILRQVTGPVTRGRLGDQKQPGTHTRNKSRRAQVSDAVGDSSQVEEWNDDEPLF